MLNARDLPGTEAQTEYRLTVPADARFVSTARLFCGAVSRAHGIDEESVGDLKIAISEACASAMSEDTQPIDISLQPDGGRLTVRISGVTSAAEREPAGDATFDDTTYFTMIQALFEDARLERSAGKTFLVFTIASIA